RLEISSQADRRFGTLSMGEIRLVGIALALMGTPRRLILDEPFHGLDALERERVLRCLRNPCPDRTILFATQLPQEVETFADRVVVLRAGKILFKGTIEEFRKIADQRVWEITAPLQQIEQLQIHGARVIRNRGEITTIRGLGKPPQYAQAILVMPTVEDAYLWLMRQYERNANR
ncbi:MAG: ATP-binding cassette domain-containing protein, partial [Anaerolineaceae bacterium]